MAKLGNAFDSSQHEDMKDGFDPMPAGKYVMVIDESDVLPTQKKNGKYIKLRMRVLNGEYKGRFVWTNINIVNPNPVAVEIAQKELATICRACGKAVIQDTQQLHGIPMVVKLKVTPAKGDYPSKNEPIGYEPTGTNLEGSTEEGWDDDEPEKTPEEQYDDSEVPWGDEE